MAPDPRPDAKALFAFPETVRWVQGTPRGTVLCWELVYILKSESFLILSLSFTFQRKQLHPGLAHSGFRALLLRGRQDHMYFCLNSHWKHKK